MPFTADSCFQIALIKNPYGRRYGLESNLLNSLPSEVPAGPRSIRTKIGESDVQAT